MQMDLQYNFKGVSEEFQISGSSIIGQFNKKSLFFVGPVFLKKNHIWLRSISIRIRKPAPLSWRSDIVSETKNRNSNFSWNLYPVNVKPDPEPCLSPLIQYIFLWRSLIRLLYAKALGVLRNRTDESRFNPCHTEDFWANNYPLPTYINHIKDDTKSILFIYNIIYP